MSDTLVPANNPQFQRPDPYDDEISLLDLAITLAKHKKLILGLPIAVAVIVAAVTLFMPATYTATTKLLLQSGEGVSKEIFVSLMQSQPMGDSLVARFDLQKAYGVTSLRDARAVLTAATSVKLEKDGSITLDVDDSNPERAAVLANAYPGMLQKLTSQFILTPWRCYII
ncbi:Wzz/FepE/Etk N-terminal domain-containing protein, partial [Pelodictyon luteolum]|uniref:Wzz/FepE/Etk N-terminal domain-containing protein n=1 Tax=Pelodictyon luteolum TaxID=1100 RepID=UPI0026ECDB2C